MTKEGNTGIIKEGLGKCHVCKGEPLQVKWCGACKHYFCKSCRKKPFDRAREAIRERLYGRQPNCCGVN